MSLPESPHPEIPRRPGVMSKNLGLLRNDNPVLSSWNPPEAGEGSQGGVIDFVSYQSELRSVNKGFVVLINSSFLLLNIPLICFSLPIAAVTSSVESKYTSRLTLYFLVHPSINLFLCSNILRSRSLVIPVYKVPDLLAII